ncbi:MAG TPA: hypothetical protein VEK39_09480, partial [Solirubrobacterales bacterium]|nr:hypothetical protein [Solirubrobacterales bacterium]
MYQETAAKSLAETQAHARAPGQQIRSFIEGHCGLVDPATVCRRSRRIGRAIKVHRVDPEQLLFARTP